MISISYIETLVMHGFKRGTGSGPLRLTLAWAEAMKNWSWDRIRYVISPSHHVFGELQINAIRAEVPLMPDTYWAYGRPYGSYPRTAFGEVAWSMLNQELSIVRARICSGAKSQEWVKKPALFHAFSSLSFFVFEAS